MGFAVAGRHHDDAGGFRRRTDLRGIGRCTNSAFINGGGSDRTASGIELPCDPWRLAPPSLSHLDSALWRSWEGSEKLGFSSSIRTLSEYIGEEESSQAGTPRTTEQATPAEVPFSANGGAREEAQTRPLMAALGRFHELASGRKAVLQAHGPKADPLNVAFGSGAVEGIPPLTGRSTPPRKADVAGVGSGWLSDLAWLHRIGGLPTRLGIECRYARV